MKLIEFTCSLVKLPAHCKNHPTYNKAIFYLINIFYEDC
jgi:hypothetical protein